MNLENLRRDWVTLGQEDPLWAVLVQDGKRGGQWDVEEFFATGRADVSETIEWLTRLGLPTRWDRVLDFGCGVGRLTQALAAHADEVIGVDLSESMLELARKFDQGESRSRFVLNLVDDLRQFPDGYVDLVYCLLVLQHMPRPTAKRYLAEFLRILRPGGLAIVQFATAPAWNVKGAIVRILPGPVVRWLQRRLLGYPASMMMTTMSAKDVATVAGLYQAEVVAESADSNYGADWRSARYVLRRRPD